MSETDFARYTNLLIFIKEWRKYVMESKELNLVEFRESMQLNYYTLIKCIDNKQNKIVNIYLFDKSSKYIDTSSEMKKLILSNKINIDLILISQHPLKTYHRTMINEQKKYYNIHPYLHEIFDLVLPNGPLCYPHRIMTHEEVLKLTNEQLCCFVVNLPKILDTDPQCIWIGAEVGNVVEVQMLSDIIGLTYQYRVVISKNKKLLLQTIDYDDDKNSKRKRKTIIKKNGKKIIAEISDKIDDTDIDDDMLETKSVNDIEEIDNKADKKNVIDDDLEELDDDVKSYIEDQIDNNSNVSTSEDEDNKEVSNTKKINNDSDSESISSVEK